MENNFERYLMLLESKAPADRKADFHAAVELYRSGAWKPRMEMALPQFDRNFSGLGRSAALDTFRTPGTGIEHAKRDPEMVSADKERAAAIRRADAEFPAAADTVTKTAETEPGKVDAWVDYRLRPAINRAKKSDGLGGAGGSKAKYKADYKAARNKYRAEDAEARETEKRDMEDALARSREFEEVKAADEKRALDAARMAEAEKKRGKLGSNREYKYSADMPLNATDMDINRHVATARSSDTAKAEDADRKIRSAEKFWSDNGDTPEFGKPMSPEAAAKEKAERKRLADFADSLNFDNYMADVAAVNIKGLRAAFESVYGDSSRLTDNEIRLVCESCYRRSKKK